MKSGPSVYLVIEGAERDETLVRHVLRAADLESPRLVIEHARGKMKASKRARELADEGARVAVLIDLDETMVPDAEKRAREQLGLDDTSIAVFCGVPEIEAWLFADDGLLREWPNLDDDGRKVVNRLPLPEEIPHPSELATSILGPHRFWSSIEKMDIGRACARSPSLRAFLEGIAGLLGSPSPPILRRVARSMNRDFLASLLSEVSPAETIMWRTLDGTTYTARELKAAIEEGSDIGAEYASDLLRVSRDYLRRAAQRGVERA